MPVEMGVSVPEKLAVHFFRPERFCRRLLNERHFLEKSDFETGIEKMKLRFVLFAEKQRISVEMLVISYHRVTR